MSASSRSGWVPLGARTVMRTIPSSCAWRSSRDTLGCDRRRRAAISGCFTPDSWYRRATRVISRSSSMRAIRRPPRSGARGTQCDLPAGVALRRERAHRAADRPGRTVRSSARISSGSAQAPTARPARYAAPSAARLSARLTQHRQTDDVGRGLGQQLALHRAAVRDTAAAAANPRRAPAPPARRGPGRRSTSNAARDQVGGGGAAAQPAESPRASASQCGRAQAGERGHEIRAIRVGHRSRRARRAPARGPRGPRSRRPMRWRRRWR